jgi:hypothetical protein
MNGGPCFECMEVYAVSFRNCLEITGAGEDSMASELGLSDSELQRRCHGGGITRDAWITLGRWAKYRNIMFARRECLTCFREQFVIPQVYMPADVMPADPAPPAVHRTP